MERDTILTALRDHKQTLSAKYGVTRLGVFGSVARNETSESSDVDVVVVMPPDLFYMVHIKEELEDLLVAPVDLVRYHKYLNRLLKERIDREAIYV
jgi:uncharacterized protein